MITRKEIYSRKTDFLSVFQEIEGESKFVCVCIERVASCEHVPVPGSFDDVEVLRSPNAQKDRRMYKL